MRVRQPIALLMARVYSRDRVRGRPIGEYDV